MTKVQTKAKATSPFVGMSVNELIALAKAEPAKLAAIRVHAAAKLLDLTARSANSAKLSAWASIADGTLAGWPTPAKPVAKAKAAKTAKPSADKAQVLAALQALIAQM